jgi:iron complex outermembrane recepter protein
MSKLFKYLQISTALGALCAVSPVLAQGGVGAASAPSDDENIIVVTAQKREQRLLDVPVAVSTVSAASLVDQNLVSIKDFYTRVPGIQLSGNTTQDISLRGINTGGGTNPTVSILIDDVQFGSSTYLGRPPIPDLDPATLQRVEVLRGPQGTFYGASSLGGLIKYVTKDPSTSSFSGRVELGANTVENGGQGWSARGAINLPIVKDMVGLSVSGFYRDDPRYIDSVTPSGALVKDANKNEVYGGRAALLLRPFERLTVTLSALYQKQNVEGETLIPICSTCSTALGSSIPVTYDPRGVPDLRTARAAVVPIVNELQLYTGRVALELADNMQLVSITAWGRSSQDTVSDLTSRFGPPLQFNLGIPGTPVYPTGGTYLFSQPILTNKFSQEVRLSGTSNIADWMVGLFYTNERSTLAQRIDRVGAAPIVTVYNGDNVSRYEEKAVFGDVIFHATDKLDIQLGGRYAANEQTYNVLSTIDVPAQVIFGPNENSLFNSRENAFTWVIAPTYKFSLDLMAYARVAKGYRPGGPNTQTPGAAPSFGADTVINYELGLKGSVLDRKLTFDVAAFQIDWNNIQLQNTALPSQFVFFENGKKARSWGLEASMTARPLHGLTVDANATILDAKLTQTLDPSTATVQRLLGQAGDRLPYSAKFTGNISVQQDFDITDRITAYAGFNVNYIGNRLGLLNQNAATAVIPRATLPSFTVVDLRAGLGLDDRWKLNFYVRNLFDEQGVTRVDTRQGTQLPQAVFITPRTIGLTVSADF